MENKRVTVGIVTYNRKEYLLKELNGLISGTVKPVNILIVDNCSDDGTVDLFNINKYKFCVVQRATFRGVNILYYRNNENKGGSFAFKQVFELFLNNFDSPYLWLMDDDVCPTSDCLEKLLMVTDENGPIACPTRIGENFKENYVLKYKKSNFIGINRKQYSKIYSKELASNSIDTVFFPFEGPLIPRAVIEKVGTPNDAYYFQFDDADYSLRCSKVAKIKYLKDAILNRQIPVTLKNSFDERRFYYTFRNTVYFHKLYCSKFIFTLRLISIYTYLCIGNILRFDFKKYRIAKKAISDALHNRMGKQL